ncbi:MAG: hypothetical protein MZW92_16805 [Comamonadaceae bacterium]|nr:hypothetical protein [Comamonadaceae bacterium]
MADGEARKLGLLVDWKRPEARPVLLDCLRAYEPHTRTSLGAMKVWVWRARSRL